MLKTLPHSGTLLHPEPFLLCSSPPLHSRLPFLRRRFSPPRPARKKTACRAEVSPGFPPQPVSVRIPIGDRHILAETGHIGRQASASVTVTDGETVYPWVGGLPHSS